MKYAAEIRSSAMIYIPSYINIDSGIHKLIEETHRQHGNHINLLPLFQIKESGLIART
jgi:hypothetical protein